MQHFLGHEILECRHLGRFIRDLICKARRDRDDTFRIADDDIAGEYRRIAASDRPLISIAW